MIEREEWTFRLLIFHYHIGAKAMSMLASILEPKPRTLKYINLYVALRAAKRIYAESSTQPSRDFSLNYISYDDLTEERRKHLKNHLKIKQQKRKVYSSNPS